METCGQRKLAALLFTHTVLTWACAGLCMYTLLKVHHTEQAWIKTQPLVDKGICLSLLKFTSSPYLNFTVDWNSSLMLEHGSEVMVPYAGPYIISICAFVRGNGTKGNLTLSQGHTNISFELMATSVMERCVRYQKVISLYENEKVTFSFTNSDEPYRYLEVLQVVLHYLLGAQEIDTPEYGPLT